MSHLIITD